METLYKDPIKRIQAWIFMLSTGPGMPNTEPGLWITLSSLYPGFKQPTTK